MDKNNVNNIDSQGKVDLDSVFVVDSNTKLKDLMTTKKRILLSHKEYGLVISIIHKLIELNKDSSGGQKFLGVVRSMVRDKEPYYRPEFMPYDIWYLKIFKSLTSGYEVDTAKRFFVKVPYSKDYFYSKKYSEIDYLSDFEIKNPLINNTYDCEFTEKELKERGLDNPIFEKTEVKYPEDEE